MTKHFCIVLGFGISRSELSVFEHRGTGHRPLAKLPSIARIAKSSGAACRNACLELVPSPLRAQEPPTSILSQRAHDRFKLGLVYRFQGQGLDWSDRRSSNREIRL